MTNDQTDYDYATAQAIAALDRAILQEFAELERQAGRYAYDGLDISQSDCWWLIAKIRAGALQLVSADLMAALRSGCAVEA